MLDFSNSFKTSNFLCIVGIASSTARFATPSDIEPAAVVPFDDLAESLLPSRCQWEQMGKELMRFSDLSLATVPSELRRQGLGLRKEQDQPGRSA